MNSLHASQTSLSTVDAKEPARTGSGTTSLNIVPLHDEIKILPGETGDVNTLLGDYFRKASTSGRKWATGLSIASLAGIFYVWPRTHLVGDFNFYHSDNFKVKEGYIGLRLVSGKAEVVPPGWTCNIWATMTAWEKKKLTDPVINKATLWIVTVDKDKFGLAWEQGEPLILGPGVHIRNSSFFAFHKFVNQNTNVISHGPYHRIIVEQGHRAISWLGDKPLLLLPGVHTINSSIFRYGSSAPNDKQVVNLAPYTVVTVRDGEVGVGYRRGVLSVLEPGEHWLNSQVNEVFVDFLPTTKQVMLLKPLDVLTSDGLILRVRGSICFHINDPIKTLKTVGNQILYGAEESKGAREPKQDYLDKQQNISSKLFGTIMLRADTTFASILTGSEALSSMALGMAKTHIDHDSAEPHHVVATGKGGKGKEIEKHKGAGMSSVEVSRQELTHLLSRQFKQSLAKEFHSEWGVNLDDMVILEVDIMDKDVRAALATGIKSNIEANTNRRNAEAKAETERILAAGTRDGVRIKAEGEAAHIKMIAKAEAEAGEMLQASPASFQIRMAETSVKAFNKGSLIIAPDGGTQSLLGMIGATQQVVGTRHQVH